MNMNIEHKTFVGTDLMLTAYALCSMQHRQYGGDRMRGLGSAATSNNVFMAAIWVENMSRWQRALRGSVDVHCECHGSANDSSYTHAIAIAIAKSIIISDVIFVTELLSQKWISVRFEQLSMTWRKL